MMPYFNMNQTSPRHRCNEAQNNSNFCTCQNCSKNQAFFGPCARRNSLCNRCSPQNCCCECEEKNNQCTCDVDGGVF